MRTTIRLFLAALCYAGYLAMPFLVMAGALPMPNQLAVAGWAWLWIVLLITGICLSDDGTPTQDNPDSRYR
jgi:hypothetical protein